MGKRSLAAVAIAVTVALAGCAQQRPQPAQQEFTPEQKQAMVDAFVNRMKNGPQQAAAAPAVAPPPATALPPQAVSEAQIGATLAALPPLSTGVTFEERQDGFDINGVRYVDPEGQIVKYAADGMTGDVTYLARLDQATYSIKTMRVFTNQPALKLATAFWNGNSWQVQTVSGLTISGRHLIPSRRGFAVVRDGAGGAGFLYTAGQGLTNFAPPQGFNIAAFQHGDIGGTGFILVEKQQAPGGGGLISSLQGLGSHLGVAEKADYALVGIKSGKVIPLNIAIEDNDVSLYGRCRKVNFAANQCADAQFVSALFKQDGTPNVGHYFWRVYWYGTKGHPIVVVQQNGLRDVDVIDLETGIKANAFDRTLGINGFTSRQSFDGTISIVANMGFSKETVADAQALLDKNGAPPAPAQ